VQNALNGNVAAQIFYLKTQCGWKETQVVENRGVDYDRMSEKELIRSIAERANQLGVKIDMSIGEQQPHTPEQNHRRGGKRRELPE
jgi:hypothetical protein